MNNKIYVQFGAGNEAIPGWLNFDASPTLRIQKIPLFGRIVRPWLNCVFDDEIQYGDIVKGLSLKDNSVDGLFCSHVLEHLTLADFSLSLNNCYRYLKQGGIFRIIVPDLDWYITRYLSEIKSSDADVVKEASIKFIRGTNLGMEQSRLKFSTRIIDAFSGRGHRWMWNFDSLSSALIEHGFVDIKKFEQGQCDDELFIRPERNHQFGDKGQGYGLAIECHKPN